MLLVFRHMGFSMKPTALSNTEGVWAFYLKGVLAADVVVRLHRRDDVAGEGDAAQDRLLPAVCWMGDTSKTFMSPSHRASVSPQHGSHTPDPSELRCHHTLQKAQQTISTYRERLDA